MTTVDITFGTTLSKGDEFGNLNIFKLTELYGSGFTELCDMMNYQGCDKVINEASTQVRKEMISDVDLLIADAKKELIKAKALSKEMFPIRYRLEILKLAIKYPKAFIYGLIKM